MSEHSTGQVAASAAKIYDSFFVPALFAQWPAHVLAAANVQAGDDVLDVACGTGVVACAALDTVGTNGSVTGVDLNDGMLAVARAKSPAVTWQTGDAGALPFDDGSFDRVVSQFGLMFFPDRAGALREMQRVARPGGRVAVAVWGSLAATPGYKAMAGLLGDLFGADAAASVEVPYVLGDPATLRALFDEAGIAAVRIETVNGSARFASLEQWLYTDIRGWTLADSISDDDYERLVAAAPSALSQFVGADGSVTFDAPVNIATFDT